MKRISDKLLIALYIFAIVIGITARFVRIIDRKTIDHDETWAYLNATGHLGEYNNDIYINKEYPVGNWVPASEWKRWTQPEVSFILGTIKDDTVHFESHPPLYFWLLHLWTLPFGTDIWTGLLLNIFIDLVILLILLLFAFECFKSWPEVILVASIWILSPISIDASSWIRQYELFTLLTLLFAYLVFKFIYSPEKLQMTLVQALMLVTVTTAGMLTHYYFVLVILTAVVLVNLRFMTTKDKTRFIILFVCLGTAGVLFVLTYPDFYLQFLRYEQSTFELEWMADLTYRIGRTVRINIFLFSPVFLMMTLIIWEYIYPWGTADFKKFWKSLSDFITSSKKQPAVFYTFGFAILIIDALILLYVSRISPQHAMAAKYVSIVGPFAAFISVFCLKLSRPKTSILIIFCTSMIVLSMVTALYPSFKRLAQNSLTPRKPNASEVVVIDNLAHGILPTITFSLEDSTQVFAGSQEYLITHPQSWLPLLTEKGGLYVSTTGSFDGTKEETEKILDLIDNNNQIISDSTVPWESVRDWGNLVTTYRVIPHASMSTSRVDGHQQ